jgi:hypothetical protein
LFLPWIVSLLGGPLFRDIAISDLPAAAQWMIPVQQGLLMTAAVLPFALLPWMQSARRFTLVIGTLNFVLTFFATSLSIIALSPGS